MWKKHYEEFVCEVCGKEARVLTSTLEKRKHSNGAMLCLKCYKEIVPKHGPKPIDFYPEKIRDIIHLDVLPYERVMEVKDELRTKKKVSFKCKICGKESVLSFTNMRIRKYAKLEPVCADCILRYATGTDEWKKINSAAQFIAQNRPEVLEKQRAAQNRLIETDPLYVDKRRSNSYISGIINGIYFDSSWELFFIIYCFENEDIESIQRYEGKIQYKDRKNKTRYYNPDFFIKYKNGEIGSIVEIKGEQARNVDEKEISAKEKFGSRYLLYRYGDLRALGLYVQSANFIREWYKKAFDCYDVKFNDNKCYRKLKEKIEKWEQQDI